MKKLIGILILGSHILMAQNSFDYTVDLTTNTDTFAVSLTIPGKLGKSENIFQFPSTAPGTYQTQNIGRFVSDFKVYNAKGKELKTTFIAPNQYIISKSHKAAKVTYKVAETFDTRVTEYPVYMMCGSSLERDHALINAHTIMGYVKGHQGSPYSVRLIGNENWTTGTALPSENGLFKAESFDHLVDSPILTGEHITTAQTEVSGTPIRLFCYSEKGQLTAEPILENMEEMLHASQKFLVKLPVDQYTFLYYFMQNPDGVTGAWEHSYSSEYVLGEGNPTEEFMDQVTDIASHEFFHIVTPLNIHSEIIEEFNFVEPTPSEHLWLYEGVTEWASNILLMRGGVTSLDEYLQGSVIQKILVNDVYFDKSWSLARIAEESFNTEGAKQYGNIYYKGSLTAGYLDIRLLELSNGQRGLREVMLELVKKYGKGNPFNEKTFFADLTAMTYPEIGDFIERYIKNAEELPHEEYLNKIGLNYARDGRKIKITKMPNPTDSQKMLLEVWQKNMPLE